MAHERTVEALAGLGQKQRVRVTTDDAALDARVAEGVFVPDERLRIELSPGVEEEGRYQVRATFADGGWSSPELRYCPSGHASPAWRVVGEIRGVTPLEESAYPERN